MLFLNPQWQGAGTVQALENGARVLSAFLNKPGIIEVRIKAERLDETSQLPEELEKDFNIVGTSVTESIADSVEKLKPLSPILKILVL